MKTFDEWSNLGFKIIKGSKAEWVDGVAMFSKNQVIKKTIRRKTFDRNMAYDSISPYGDSYDAGGSGVGMGVDYNLH